MVGVAAWHAGVAPRAGAWIETGRKGVAMTCNLVAPRAGAWIETQATIEK